MAKRLPTLAKMGKWKRETTFQSDGKTGVMVVVEHGEYLGATFGMPLRFLHDLHLLPIN